MKKRAFCLIAAVLLTAAFLCPVHAQSLQSRQSVYLGSYPQTLVRDTELTQQLASLNADWHDYPYYAGTGEYGSMRQTELMRYCDVAYQGQRYRGVAIDVYRPSYPYLAVGGATEYLAQFKNGYYQQTVCWFRYEPVEWVVLDAASGLLITKNVLDAQAFSDTVYYKATPGVVYDGPGMDVSDWYSDAACTVYMSNYEQSSIRSWLNDTFLGTAFNWYEQRALRYTTLQNDDFRDQAFSCPATSDRVYFLSYQDVMDSALFTNVGSYSDPDPLMPAPATDYAKAQGASCGTDGAHAHWWLRTSFGSEYVVCVHEGGFVAPSPSVAYNTTMGCRPCVSVDPALLDYRDYVVGDPDLDGTVTPADARIALRVSVGLEPFAETDIAYLACDADRDGTVTPEDARLILRAAVGLEKLPGR